MKTELEPDIQFAEERLAEWMLTLKHVAPCEPEGEPSASLPDDEEEK